MKLEFWGVGKQSAYTLVEKHISIEEGTKGVTFESLFGQYLQGASKIIVKDPYIRTSLQTRNFMDLCATIYKLRDNEDDVAIHLITVEDRVDEQSNRFREIKKSLEIYGVAFTWEFLKNGTIHARSIETDAGWKISLDRGLDIYQKGDSFNVFDLTNRLQECRICRAFEVTYIRMQQKLTA